MKFPWKVSRTSVFFFFRKVWEMGFIPKWKFPGVQTGIFQWSSGKPSLFTEEKVGELGKFLEALDEGIFSIKAVFKCNHQNIVFSSTPKPR